MSRMLQPGHEAAIVRYHPQTKMRYIHPGDWGLQRTYGRAQTPYSLKVEAAEDGFLGDVIDKGLRCLIPMEAFYVWFQQGSGKQPFATGRRDKKMMAAAGVWHTAVTPTGDKQRSFAILTTRAAGVVGVLADRMPVMLEEAEWPLWLGEVEGDVRALLDNRTGCGLTAWMVCRKTHCFKGAEDQVPYKEITEPLNSTLIGIVAKTTRFVNPKDPHRTWNDKPSSPMSLSRTTRIPLYEPPLAPSYDLPVGDSFVPFAVTAEEVASSLARLTALQESHNMAMSGYPSTQRNLEFRQAAQAVANCLSEARRLSIRISQVKALGDHDWMRGGGADNVAYRQELCGLGTALAHVGSYLLAWTAYPQKWFPEPMSWVKLEKALRDFRVSGSTDPGSNACYVRAAEATASVADSLVTFLEGAARAVAGEATVAPERQQSSAEDTVQPTSAITGASSTVPHTS